MKKYKAGDKYNITLTEEMAEQLNVIESLGFNAENCDITSFTFKTKQYKLITKLLGNRVIKVKNVENKRKLLDKNGFKSSNPVIINVDGKIIDGQHRRMAAEELKIAYKFTVDVDATAENSLQNTIELNNSGKPWTTTDYIIAYAENGNEEYQKLIDLTDELGVNYSKMFALYNGTKLNGDQRKQIANGTFKFEDDKADAARERKDELDNLLNQVENQRYKKLVESEAFYVSYLEIRRKDNFKYKILSDQFDKLRYTILDRKNLTESLVDVYNMQRRTNRIKY